MIRWRSGKRSSRRSLARELDPACAGFRGVSFDITWDRRSSKEIDAPFDPGKLITPNLPAFLDRDARQRNRHHFGPGSVLSFSSAMWAGRSAISLPERFCLLHFQALEPAEDSLFRIGSGCLTHRDRARVQPARTRRSISSRRRSPLSPAARRSAGDRPGRDAGRCGGGKRAAGRAAVPTRSARLRRLSETPRPWQTLSR